MTLSLVFVGFKLMTSQAECEFIANALKKMSLLLYFMKSELVVWLSISILNGNSLHKFW